MELGFNYFGLSALQNSPDAYLVALFPLDIKQPTDYKLIRIVKSKKTNIVNKKSDIEPAIIVEEWDYLPSDQIYVDIPYEKRIVKNLFKESSIYDEQIASSLQAPIMSSPYVIGLVGGISFSSIAGNSTFAQELVKTVQLMMPPEYRSFEPPEKAFNGVIFSSHGIKYHFADRPYHDRNILCGIQDHKCEQLSNEIINRSNFNGEYSIFSTMSPISGNITQMWVELMGYFSNIDVMLPENLDELPSMDIDLTGLRNVINEDLWIQIVHSRQLMPSFKVSISDSYSKYINQLYNDYDALLTDIYKKNAGREFLVRTMMSSTKFSLRRLSQTFARADDKDIVNEDDLKRARNLIVDNFNGFINHDLFKFIRDKMERKTNESRYNVVQITLLNTPKLTINETYDSIKSSRLFTDIYDLQKFLDWLRDKNYVIYDMNKRYSWIGKI